MAVSVTVRRLASQRLTAAPSSRLLLLLLLLGATLCAAQMTAGGAGTRTAARPGDQGTERLKTDKRWQGGSCRGSGISLREEDGGGE
ncbi:hypothetical protein Hamer_G012263 [Homarus americanus]|uniref:Uncharacterized protein n=1 Tax=Homarus americanus TaxID=6706 RepID=A0A8J5K532_HOMAM|nr:hypothetical protein Hamer_G012263 [Homarus americanus]